MLCGEMVRMAVGWSGQAGLAERRNTGNTHTSIEVSGYHGIPTPKNVSQSLRRSLTTVVSLRLTTALYGFVSTNRIVGEASTIAPCCRFNLAPAYPPARLIGSFFGVFCEAEADPLAGVTGANGHSKTASFPSVINHHHQHRRLPSPSQNQIFHPRHFH